MKERIGEIFGNFKGIPVDIPPTLRVMVSWKLSHQTKAAPILNCLTNKETPLCTQVFSISQCMREKIAIWSS